MPEAERRGGRLRRRRAASSHHSPNLLATAELGLVAERIELPATSYWNGRVLGDTRMRTETGVSVVAVLRRAEAIPPRARLPAGPATP